MTAPSYEQIRNLLGRYTERMDLGDFEAQYEESLTAASYTADIS